uniref:CSON004451 protein n=1 Tax=Culicoides sonorensis TaxID=179676 RepID=A0A336KDM6_CULSO
MVRITGSNRDKECDRLILEKISSLNSAILRRKDITLEDLEEAYKKSINYQSESFFGLSEGKGVIFTYGVLLMVLLFVATPALVWLFEYILSTRCFIGMGYLTWEMTRPISDCRHCSGLTSPIIFDANITREEFEPYAYSSQPIIVKGAAKHWEAMKSLNYTFLRDIYQRIPGAIESVHDECQFLHFKSNFVTLRDVFEKVKGEEPLEDGNEWYVGWSNCHYQIKALIRQLIPYPPLPFLPEDAELSNTDFIFLGYDHGATMHIDYIPRLMWQAQLRGEKIWSIVPTPECEDLCHSFSFSVEPGDILLLDTRIWYHETHIPKEAALNLFSDPISSSGGGSNLSTFEGQVLSHNPHSFMRVTKYRSNIR